MLEPMQLPILHTTGTASVALGVSQSTLISIESRGAVGPWYRDASGRRLLAPDDVAEVKRYLAQRGRTTHELPA